MDLKTCYFNLDPVLLKSFSPSLEVLASRADSTEVENDCMLEDVILPNLGHVHGIGRSWGEIAQDDVRLLQNPIFASNRDPGNPDTQPVLFGVSDVNEFSQLIGI